VAAVAKAARVVAVCFHCGGNVVERQGAVLVTIACDKCFALYTRKKCTK